MLLLIGSRALIHAGEQYLSSANRSWDWDWIAPYDSFESHRKTFSKDIKKIVPMNRGKTIAIFRKKNKAIEEFEIAWDDSTAIELLDILSKNRHLVQNGSGKDVLIANPDVVFTLKKSHRYLKDSPHFMKTMLDYRHLRDECGCKVPEELKDWYKKRVKETYWYKHPNLNVDKKDFFKEDDGVPYIYDHDTIHLAMAHFDKPAYEYFKAENEEVKCSKDLFFECSEEIRLHAVLEESYVLALERSQIPAPGVWTPKKSFTVALQKVASSITSGWFREYAYEHYFDVMKLYDDNYLDRFNKGVKTGLVKKL